MHDEETVFKIMHSGTNMIQGTSSVEESLNAFESKRVSHFDPYDNYSKPEDYLRISLSFKNRDNLEPNSFR